MATGNTLPDALIVTALAATFVSYLYFKHLERRRRMEIVHQERLVAMDKGIPLPELPLEPATAPKIADPRDMLVHGIVWTAFGFGGMVALQIVKPIPGVVLWPLTLPLFFLGVGLMLYYFLAARHTR